MSDKGVYRTAPATPGFLNIMQKGEGCEAEEEYGVINLNAFLGERENSLL